jgi:hypothetical protein
MSVESGGKTEMNKAIREEEWIVVSRKCKENNASEYRAQCTYSRNNCIE